MERRRIISKGVIILGFLSVVMSFAFTSAVQSSHEDYLKSLDTTAEYHLVIHNVSVQGIDSNIDWAEQTRSRINLDEFNCTPPI